MSTPKEIVIRHILQAYVGPNTVTTIHLTTQLTGMQGSGKREVCSHAATEIWKRKMCSCHHHTSELGMSQLMETSCPGAVSNQAPAV